MKYKIFSIIVFLTILFPYISFLNTPFDLQPWALVGAAILACIIFYKRHAYVPRALQALGLITLYASVILALELMFNLADPVMGIRALVGYISIAVFAFVGFHTFKEVNVKVYIGAVVAWLIGGIVQIAYGAQVLSLFVSRLSTDAARGMTSFSSEPAVYATVCMSFIVLNEIFYKEERYSKKWYVALTVLLLVQITLGSSGVGMVLLLLFGGAKMTGLFLKSQTRVDRYLGLCTMVLILASIVCQKYAPLKKDTGTVPGLQTRSSYIIEHAVADPVKFVQKDLSISLRLFNPVLALQGGLVESKGLGMGLGTISEKPIPRWLADLIGKERTYGGQVLGGLVGAIYELGVIGVIFNGILIWIVVMSIWRTQIVKPPLFVSAAVIFFPAFITGSMAFPLLGYIFGIHLYYYYNSNNYKINPI